MTSKDKNKLIADFMGYSKPHPDYPNSNYWYKKGEQPLTTLLFDVSWDWLMPVVEAVENKKMVLGTSLQWDEVGESHCFEIQPGLKHTFNLLITERDNKIDAVYDGIVEFIQTYNQLKKQLD